MRSFERFFASAIAAGCLLLASAALAEPMDQVNLQNGGLVRGTIMEEDPVKGVSIRLLDGTTRQIPSKDVKKVVYGQAAPAAVAPAAAPPATAPPPPAADYNDVVHLVSGMDVRCSVKKLEEKEVVVATAQGEQRILRSAIARIEYNAASKPLGASAQPSALEGDRFAPSTHRSRRRSLKELWIPSLALWSATYAATIGVTAGIVVSNKGDGKPIGESAIPFAGPWVLIGDGDNKLDHDGGRMALTVLSGVLQNLCLVGFIVGVSVHTGGQPDYDSKAPRFLAAPVVGPGFAGVGAALLNY